jgi:hypothetical protein
MARQPNTYTWSSGCQELPGLLKTSSVEDNLKALNDLIESGKLSLVDALAATRPGGALRGAFNCCEDETMAAHVDALHEFVLAYATRALDVGLPPSPAAADTLWTALGAAVALSPKPTQAWIAAGMYSFSYSGPKVKKLELKARQVRRRLLKPLLSELLSEHRANRTEVARTVLRYVGYDLVNEI